MDRLRSRLEVADAPLVHCSCVPRLVELWRMSVAVCPGREMAQVECSERIVRPLALY